MVRVKICGLTHEADIALCVAEGVNALGFVVEYPQPTPWTLTRARAAELMRTVPPFVSRVAVVGGDAQTILELCAATQPDAVQLHGDESEATVKMVAAGLAGTGTRVIKAVRIRPGQRVAGSTDSGESDWVEVAQRFLDAGAHAILLDSKADHRPGGTGQTFDWQIAQQVAKRVGPLLLAGGLTPENVGGAIAEVHPYAVDVISSLEDAQRRKAPARVRAFIRAVQAASVS